MCQSYELRRQLNRVRWIACRYISYHKITRSKCQLCDKGKAQMHHPDYNNPFQVNFLCSKCHAKVTGNKVKAPGIIDLKERATA